MNKLKWGFILFLIIMGLVFKLTPKPVPLEVRLNTEKEILELKNNLNVPIEIAGWKVLSVSNNIGYMFMDGMRIYPMQTIYILTGENNELVSNGINVFKMLDVEMWNDNNDRIIIFDENDKIIFESDIRF